MLKMVAWVFEKNVFSEKCFDAMISWCKETSTEYHTIKIIPFIHEVDGKLPNFNSNKIIVYGSIGIQKTRDRNNWKPGIFTSDELNETNLIENLGDLYLNNDAKICLLKDLPNIDEEVIFVKPNTDTKEFAGTVMSKEKISSWISGMIKSGYVEESFLNAEVVYSIPKNIGCEWRLVIVDKQIVAYSVYKQYGIVRPEMWLPDAARNFAETIVDKYSPLDIYVMDICQIESGEFKVIEYNTFNSSGLYDCHIPTIMEAVTNFVLVK